MITENSFYVLLSLPILFMVVIYVAALAAGEIKNSRLLSLGDRLVEEAEYEAERKGRSI